MRTTGISASDETKAMEIGREIAWKLLAEWKPVKTYSCDDLARMIAREILMLDGPLTNPYDTPDYRAFIESMVPHCRCEYDSPCDGVLAGGVCDEKRKQWYEFSNTEND